MRTELGLAWAGLRARPGPWCLLGLGIALAALMPLLAAGAQIAAGAGAVRSAVAAVPEPSRGVLAVTSRDLRGPGLTALDDQVRQGFAAAGLPDLQQVLAFRSLALASTDVTVGATDRLADDVTLGSGRWPAGCRPRACEVLAVDVAGGDAGAAVRQGVRALGLVVVGTATLREPRLAGLGLVTPDQPLLLGGDPGAMTGLAALATYGRNLGWLSPLDGGTVAAAGADEFAAALAGLSAEANLTAGPLNLSWPSDVVLAANERAAASASRFAVLGAGAGALQLGFCLVVAAGERRRRRAHAALLARRGARPGQVLRVATWQPLVPVLAGLLLAVVVGLPAVALLAGRVVHRPWAAAAAALGQGWPALVALGVAAVLLTVALTTWPPVAARTLRLLLGLALLAAAGLALLALVSPPAGPTAPLPSAALVALVLVVGGLGALLWSPAVAGLARLGRGGALRPLVFLPRRRPLLPSVTAGFLAAALATALLAGAYGATLRRSAEDRAAALVPLDVRITPSSTVPVPSAVVDAARLQAISPQVQVSGVTSVPVTAFAGSARATALPLAGVEPAVLPQLHRFAAVTGATEPAGELADRLRAPAATLGPTLPAGVRRPTFTVRGLDDDAVLVLWFTTPDGQEHAARLVRVGATTVRADLGVGPSRTVTGVEVVESEIHLTRRQHGIGEGSTDRALATGTLRFGEVRADGVALPWSWSGWGSDTAQVRPQDGLTVSYQLGDNRVVLVPGWVPPAGRPVLPVAVDPATAARAGSRGTFGVTLNGTTQPVRVVAVLPRMPTLPATFVLADRDAVRTLVDRTAPGTAPVNQVWVAAPAEAAAAVRAALDDSPAAAATVQYRADLAAGFAADPVATGFVRLLGAAGAVALLLGVVAVLAGVRADQTSSAADLYTLELDGVPPGRLRRLLAARGALVLAVGVPVGLAGGVGLAAAAVRLLGTGPDGRPVLPPLQLVLLAWPTVAVVLAALLVGAGAVLLAATAALREPRPAAPELDLR